MLDDLKWGNDRAAALETRLARLERKLDALMAHLDVDYDDVKALRKAVPEDVLEFIDKGESIRAIKAYRQATGASLVNAKYVIDRLSA